MSKQRLVIRHRWALGDTVLLTALIRDIHLAYPGKYDIKVDTHFRNVWENNPYVTSFEDAARPRPVKYDLSWGDAMTSASHAVVGGKKVKRHILAWYHHDFAKKSGIEVPVTTPKPDLHLSQDEKRRRLEGRYWVIVAGGKLDLTTKHWHNHRCQEVVDKLAAKGIHCVQTGAVNKNHVHPPLRNVTNLVGKTENARDLWNIILHADGVICGVTAGMHIAAAFDKPCVVYGGGREDPWFEAYVDDYRAFGNAAKSVAVPHKFLHTIGQLNCCQDSGCWKRRTVALDAADRTKKVSTLCRQPVRPENSHPVPECMDLITSDHVVNAVMEYYDDQMIPPIRATPAILKSSIASTSVPTAPEPPPKAGRRAAVKTVVLAPQSDGEWVADGDVKASWVYWPEESPEASKPEPVVELDLVRKPSVESRVQNAHQTVHPPELSSDNPKKRIKRKLSVMDNPLIGGKMTVFLLCYGPHTNLAKRSCESILDTIPPERLDLRVGVNEACKPTVDYLRSIPATKLYLNTENKYKYPLMREMFWDEKCPITTNSLTWFDDDTWSVTPRWIDDLCETIIANHHYNYRMFGTLMSHDLAIYKNTQLSASWFKRAQWYKGRNLRVRGQKAEAPNGSVIDFAVGWCWALEVAAMRAANIPDVRLRHNGGDITIGEQMHQAGYLIQQWNRGKSLIACPSKADGGRRGFSERFQWDPKA